MATSPDFQNWNYEAEDAMPNITSAGWVDQQRPNIWRPDVVQVVRALNDGSIYAHCNHAQRWILEVLVSIVVILARLYKRRNETLQGRFQLVVPNYSGNLCSYFKRCKYLKLCQTYRLMLTCDFFRLTRIYYWAGTSGLHFSTSANNVWDDGSYVLYYSGRAAEDRSEHCIGAATSDSVTGPYTPGGKALYCDLQKGGAIDQSWFVDIGGQRYVVYKVDGKFQAYLVFLPTINLAHPK